MSRNTRTVEATPEQVWQVLADGWLYPLWVVGASRMRNVDAHWPNEGAQLHHSVGSWPVMLNDVTEVIAAIPLRRLVLHARARPFGTAEVTILLAARGSKTHVELRERAVKGPGALVPGPLQDPMLKWRNQESLKRLCYLVENRPANEQDS